MSHSYVMKPTWLCHLMHRCAGKEKALQLFRMTGKILLGSKIFPIGVLTPIQDQCFVQLSVLVVKDSYAFSLDKIASGSGCR